MKNIIFLAIATAFIFSNSHSLRFNAGEHATIPSSDDIGDLDQVTLEFWYFEESFQGGDEFLVYFSREYASGGKYGIKNDHGQYQAEV